MELIKASATFSPRLLLASGLPRKIIIWSRIKHLLPCSPSVLHRVPLFLCRSEARERPEVGSSRYKRFVISLSLSLSYALFVSKGSWCCGSARSWLKSINPGENEGPDIVLDLRSIVEIDERDFTRCKPSRLSWEPRYRTLVVRRIREMRSFSISGILFFESAGVCN